MCLNKPILDFIIRVCQSYLQFLKNIKAYLWKNNGDVEVSKPTD